MTWWQQRRVSTILNVIDHLPRASHYVRALADDPEFAEAIASRPTPPREPPSLARWTDEVDLLTQIVDRLGEVAAVMAATVPGGKYRPPAPSPRPMTEVDRARARGRRNRHDALVARVLPTG